MSCVCQLSIKNNDDDDDDDTSGEWRQTNYRLKLISYSRKIFIDAYRPTDADGDRSEL